ncbi:MAG: T9SS type A sorting domain-containing protein [Chitinophagales bacterium]
MRYLILLILSVNVFSQNTITTFNQTFYADTNTISAVSLQSIGNEYFVVGDLDAINAYSATYLQRLDEYGHVISEKIIYGDYCYSTILFGNCFEKTLDNNFVFSCNKGIDELNTDYMLVKFTTLGDTIWTKTYEHTGRENHAQVVVCEEGGYLLVGVTVTGNSYQTYLIRTDDFGEVMWEREIGDVAIPLYAEQTQDNGFIISGYHYNTTTGYDMYVLKTDAEGMVEWENTYGTDESDGGCYVNQVQNGKYKLVGNIDCLQESCETKLYLASLDELGVIEWDKEYVFNEMTINSSHSFIGMDENILLVVSEWSDTDIRELHFTKFSSENGEIIWQKPIGSGISSEDYIRDIEPTADGGYILSGFNLTSPQRSWVVKTDALGNTCGIAPCDSTIYQLVDTGTYINNTRDKVFPLSIRPNPVIDRCFIDYELSAKYPFSVLELYNLKGKKVHHTLLSSHETTAQIDIAHLASGIYLYKMINVDGVLVSGKLVKE